MILLTGATGLLGGHLLIHLLQKNKQLRALKRTSSNFNELRLICRFYGLTFDDVWARVEWVDGDLLVPKSLLAALDGVDEVYHCAAMVSFSASSAEELIRANVEGTAHLVRACLQVGVRRLAYASSIGALGQSVKGKPIDEKTLWRPDSHTSVYARSKQAAEQEVWWGFEQGLQVVIVNPGIILGAGEFEKGSLQFFAQVKRGMPFYTRCRTGYVDVRDVCQALTQLIEQEIFGERFALVSESVDSKTLFSLIAEAMNRPRPFIPAGRAMLHIAYHINRLISLLTARPPLLTKEIIHSALKQDSYSSEKISQRIGFRFTPIKTCIQEVVKGMNKQIG